MGVLNVETIYKMKIHLRQTTEHKVETSIN